jgi:hypothetical protein
MDFGDLTGSIILLASGGIIALYGAGKFFPKLAGQNTGIAGERHTIFIIGLVIIVVG